MANEPSHSEMSQSETRPALLTKTLIRKYYVPAGERTLNRWISSGRFPRHDIALGGKVRWWKRETVEAWIKAQAEHAAR
jgi:predicted DNA-binding transcriptional regulator AlpA